jgi:hypothetical protein
MTPRIHPAPFAAMLSARAADASHSSLLRVSTIGGIAIAAFAALYFSGELLRAALS